MPQTETLSQQDVQDLQQIRGMLPQGDPRAAKIDALLGPQGHGASGEWDTQQPTTTQRIVSGAKNVGIGAAKGAASTLNNLGGYLLMGPAKAATALGVSNPTMQELAQSPTRPPFLAPKGTAQKAGYYGEQAGEFMLPGLGEEAAGARAAKYLPFLGRAAPVAGRLAEQTLATGALNKLQGGSFKTGAAAGLGGGLVGEGVRALAPKLAESALGVTNKMRGHGKTIGEAMLNETSGVTPSTISSQTSQRIGDLTGQLNSLASASQTAASLRPALQVLDNAEAVARSRNSAAMLSKIGAVRQQLTQDITTGQPIPPDLMPSKLLDLKRGVGELVGSWAPTEKKGIQPIIQRVYGALDKELDRTVPGAQQINQVISSLIPAKQRANVLLTKAPFLQRTAGRMAAHTGALAGAGLGSYLGYQKGGGEGALIGGLTGLALPEALSSPTAQMMAARYPIYTLPFLKGLALQAARPTAVTTE